MVAQPLGAQTIPSGTLAPTVLAWDSFERTDGNLSGSVAPSGQQWRTTISQTNWKISGNQARSSSASTIGYCVLQMNRLDAVVEVVLSSLISGANSGIDINDDDIDNLVVLYNRVGTTSTVRLYRYTGAYTQISTAAVAGTPSSITLRVSSVGSTVKVWVDGALVMTAVLAGADLAVKTTNSDNTLFGIWARSDTVTRFDNFHVDAP